MSINDKAPRGASSIQGPKACTITDSILQKPSPVRRGWCRLHSTHREIGDALYEGDPIRLAELHEAAAALCWQLAPREFQPRLPRLIARIVRELWMALVPTCRRVGCACMAEGKGR